MAIGIQTQQPATPQASFVSGRASDVRSGSQPEPEPVEIPSSSAAAHPPAFVQLTPSSIRARLQALLAGDPASPDPNTQGQVITETSVQREGRPAAAAEGFWMQFQPPELFDSAFAGAARTRAAGLLKPAVAAPANVIALSQPAFDAELTFQ